MVAIRDREWPGYTQWYCCPECGRLWTYQGSDVVALDLKFALGMASPNAEVPSRACAVCEGTQSAPAAEI
ncbi:MAG: hypothetical protein O7F12_00610 [Nitrospirae bacterium]|nr:hypothetical protein [Nitrospirota bacterium]